jgi:hypothetical protein
MTQDAELSPAAAGFAQHLQAFHGGLANEEKQLLEQILALAEAAQAAAAAGDEQVRGYAADYFLKIQGIKGEAEAHKGEIKLLPALYPGIPLPRLVDAEYLKYLKTS